jgi:hypothetical protein
MIKEIVKGVQLVCPIEQQWLEIEQFISVDVPDAYPVFHEAPTAVSKHMDMPSIPDSMRSACPSVGQVGRNPI